MELTKKDFGKIIAEYRSLDAPTEIIREMIKSDGYKNVCQYDDKLAIIFSEHDILIY